jgi:hypothetical protein
MEEWLKQLKIELERLGVTKVAIDIDDFAIIVRNYWDGMSPAEQAKWLAPLRGRRV